ncbi:hypothetical protein JHK82_054169 [Glycine max]|nr:hypothetical protein GLYMA_19G198950v4 [Glycine max]KAG5084003.1 hypothetical protein JHK84_054041 [Glycine max]KAG5086772.1 hypothetical protein JHK82_054169 [Glycine max]KAH1078707.1 hypothetical protein GYH30_053642 [Glycine max]KHN02172.1 hypothetical protein glysoja_002196 [Glycine soja]
MLHITYNIVSASVIYGQDVVLTHTLLTPFMQKTHAKIVLQIQFTAVDGFVDNGMATGFDSDRAGGWARFGLLLDSRMIYFMSDYILKANFYTPKQNWCFDA